MKALWISAFCLLTYGVCGCAPREAARVVPAFSSPPLLAVVTWNLHGEAGDLQRLAADLAGGVLTGGHPPRHRVLLLQEASPSTRVEGLHAFFAPAGTGDGVPRGNAILSSVPLADARRIELPRGRQPRAAAVAGLRVDGTRLLVVSVHLENRASWWRGGLPGDRIRARQMDALLAQLPSLPGILGGDLNIWLGTREQAYRAAAARFPDAVAPVPPPTFRERLALDHLFFRLPPGWRARSFLPESAYGSDHYPVVGTIEDGRGNNRSNLLSW